MESKVMERGEPAAIWARLDRVSGTLRLVIGQNFSPDWPIHGYTLSKEQAQALMQQLGRALCDLDNVT